jgi:hypothetical protein
MAAIPGHIKDEVVIIGGHRDGTICAFNCPNFGLKHYLSMGYGCRRSD